MVKNLKGVSWTEFDANFVEREREWENFEKTFTKKSLKGLWNDFAAEFFLSFSLLVFKEIRESGTLLPWLGKWASHFVFLLVSSTYCSLYQVYYGIGGNWQHFSFLIVFKYSCQ